MSYSNGPKLVTDGLISCIDVAKTNTFSIIEPTITTSSRYFYTTGSINLTSSLSNGYILACYRGSPQTDGLGWTASFNGSSMNTLVYAGGYTSYMFGYPVGNLATGSYTVAVSSSVYGGGYDELIILAINNVDQTASIPTSSYADWSNVSTLIFNTEEKFIVFDYAWHQQSETMNSGSGQITLYSQIGVLGESNLTYKIASGPTASMTSGISTATNSGAVGVALRCPRVIFNDFSGKNNFGAAINNPSYTGLFGGGIVFDGNNDYIEITSIPSSSWQNEWTVMGWACPTSLTDDLKGIFGWEDHGVYGLLGPKMSWYPDQGANITGSTTLSTHVYYHFAFSYKSADMYSGDRYMYLNGKLENYGGFNSMMPKTGSRSYIGKAVLFDADKQFKGTISNYALYNRMLSGAEILQNYNSTKGRYSVVPYKYTSIFGGSSYASINSTSLKNAYNYNSYALTISFWVKFNGGDGSEQTIFQSYQGGTKFLVITRNSSNQIGISANFVFADRTNQGSNQNMASSGTITSSSGWTHVFMVISSTADVGTSSLYINGVRDALPSASDFWSAGGIPLSGFGGAEWPIFRYGLGSGNILHGIGKNLHPDESAYYLNGEISELWIKAGSYPYPEKFISNSSPLNLGPDGSIPLGSKPDFYFSNNGSGNSWLVDGANNNTFTASGNFSGGTLYGGFTGTGARLLNAAVFGGGSYLTTNSVGVDNTFVNYTSGLLTYSFWVKFNDGDGTDQTIFTVYYQGSDYNYVRRNSSNKLTFGGTNLISSRTNERTNSETVSSVSVTVSSGWTHVLCALDTNNGSNSRLYINGVRDTALDTSNFGSHFPGEEWPIFRYGAGSNTPSVNIGFHPAYGQYLKGELAELWIKEGFYTDTSKFIANSSSIDLGIDGSNPTGTKPDIYMFKNSGADWGKNAGSGGSFAVYGELLKGILVGNKLL